MSRITIKFTGLLLILELLSMATAQASRDSRARRRPRRDSRTQIEEGTVEIKSNSLTLEVIPSREFDQHLDNFNLDVIHNLSVNPKDHIDYDFSVTPQESAFVWISFIIKDDARFEFSIVDRANKSVLYSSADNPEFLARLYFRRAEDLRLTFRNPVYGSYVRVLVGLECHGCANETRLADQDNVGRSLTVIKGIDSRRSKMHFVSEVYRQKQSHYLKQLKSSHRKMLLFTTAEIILVLLINVYQVCAIKGLLSRKIML